MTTTSSWSPAEAQQLLEELESSGLSVAAFARQRDIAAHRLYWARRQARTAAKKRKEPSASTAGTEFNEVVVIDRPARQAVPIDLRLPSGISIRVTRDFDEVALRRLLGLLAAC